jgi:hypothetical protein
MGHLLGAASANPDAGHELAVWVEVESITRLADRGIIAAWAIDTPRPGQRQRGTGLELEGWAIGRDVPVRGIRVSGSGLADVIIPLDVARPDVAADYPAFAHGASSGFSGWVPLHVGPDSFDLVVEAVTGHGVPQPIAIIHGRTGTEPVEPQPGHRIVCAPDFVIIGAQRGGTTSLFAYLSAHPQVVPASTKEVHYLTDNFERGRDWYLGHFPPTLPPNTITGEATPYALIHPLAPARLRHTAPDVRLIVLLRNPAERAYSHYSLERARGDEALDFATALDEEPKRLAGEEARLSRDSGYRSFAHKHHSYLARGDYSQQLERWFSDFPRRQFLILRSEDLFARPATSFARVASFLGIEPELDIPFSVHGESHAAPMDEATRRRLAEHFAPRNARLAALLGRDPGWA